MMTRLFIAGFILLLAFPAVAGYRVVKKGETNVSCILRIIDDTDGTPETGVTAATGGLVLEYRRDLAVNVSLATITDLALLTTAHTDKGIIHIGNGYYRVDVPDAAFASGVDGVLLHGTATGMVVIAEYIQLIDYDHQDGVRLGLTSLPNAAADAAGGLVISDAGGLDIDALNTNVNDIETDTQEIGAAGAGLTAVPWNAAWDAEVESEVDDSLGAGTGTSLTAIPWNAAWDAEVESEVDDSLGAGTGTSLTAVPWNAAWDAEVESEVEDAVGADITNMLAIVQSQ